MKRKSMIIGGVMAGVLLVAGLGFFIGSRGKASGDEYVYVSSVSTIVNQGSLGIQQRFSGVVEPQQTYEVTLQQDRTVKEVLVEQGQEVIVGTPLFVYDTEQSESDLAQAELELERLKNDIVNLNEQISALEKEKRSAGEDEKLSYTTQIQSAQNDIKKTEYSIKSKNMEIEQLKNNIENAQVVSEVAGLIKSVGQNNDQNGSGYITILESGTYRIKGMVNEQNMYSIAEGQPVIVRSRIDDSIWYGTMGSVDTENAQSGNENYYYSGYDDGMNQSSKYPFYVSLDSDEGLMLGQHVYIEMDMGQEEEQTGLWLPEYFICDADTDPYVWADNGKGRLEKRQVVLGEYNGDMMEYEILEGLTLEDGITFPEEVLKEGLVTQFSTEGMMGAQGMDYEEEPEYDEDQSYDEDMEYDEGQSSDEELEYGEDLTYDEGGEI